MIDGDWAIFGGFCVTNLTLDSRRFRVATGGFQIIKLPTEHVFDVRLAFTLG